MSEQPLIILVSLLLSAWFSGAETAFFSFNRALVPLWVRQQSWGAATVKFFTEKPERFLVPTLTGNNIVNVVYSSIMALWLNSQGVPEPVIFVVSPLFLLVFGETIPKAISYHTSDTVVRPVGVGLAVCRVLLWPAAKPVEIVMTAIQRRIGLKGAMMGQALSRADIRIILKQVGKTHSLAASIRPMLGKLLDLGGKWVADIMTSRSSVVSIPLSASADTAMQAMIRSGFSRLPCYSSSTDDIVGIVSAKGLLQNPAKLSDVVQPLPMVPGTLPVVSLLSWFRRNGCQFAGVIDEYGGFAGVVSLEDLLEEIVGPIHDEHDSTALGLMKISHHNWLAEGSLKLSDLAASTGVKLSGLHARTIGGAVMEILGRVPQPEEEVTIGRARVKVIRADRRRVRLVRITLKDTGDSPPLS